MTAAVGLTALSLIQTILSPMLLLIYTTDTLIYKCYNTYAAVLKACYAIHPPPPHHFSVLLLYVWGVQFLVWQPVLKQSLLDHQQILGA